MIGLWFLIPEFLRLGAWDLLRGCFRGGPLELNARLALQLVNESVLCSSTRQSRSLNQRGWEVANGLPFLASDEAVHHLLSPISVEELLQLQVALGKIRRSLGHFDFNTLIIDPHRIHSHSKRQMVYRQKDRRASAQKSTSTFFCFSANTQQPLCVLYGTGGRTVTQATRELLELTSQIIPATNPANRPLVLADSEHYTAALLDWCPQNGFDLLFPLPQTQRVRQAIEAIDPTCFHRHWAGYATAYAPFSLQAQKDSTFPMFVQRKGERPQEYDYRAFLSTREQDHLQTLTEEYPKRWHAEEFFRHYQEFGWQRAGTMNLNIRFARMSLALLAQAASYMFRQKLPDTYQQWNATHMAEDFFKAIDGDVRVKGDTIVITCYNAPNSQKLIREYSNLPEKLQKENVDPRIPWLFDYKLDFQFK